MTWIALGVVAFIALIGLAASGASGFLLVVSFVAFGTALYSLVTGRRSWALVPNRKNLDGSGSAGKTG